MLCTGQTPNTQIMKSFLPDSVIPDGPGKHSIRVTRTLQVGVPSSEPAPARSPKPTTDGQEQDEEEEDPNYSVPHPHIFAIGDAADAFGAINAGNVFSFVPDISTAKGAGSDIIRLLDSIPEVDAESDEGKKLDHGSVKGHIRLENIHFRYPTRTGVRVLRELSIEVQPGTYVALVGASGSGKSTV